VSLIPPFSFSSSSSLYQLDTEARPFPLISYLLTRIYLPTSTWDLFSFHPTWMAFWHGPVFRLSMIGNGGDTTTCLNLSYCCLHTAFSCVVVILLDYHETCFWSLCSYYYHLLRSYHLKSTSCPVILSMEYPHVGNLGSLRDGWVVLDG